MTIVSNRMATRATAAAAIGIFVASNHLLRQTGFKCTVRAFSTGAIAASSIRTGPPASLNANGLPPPPRSLLEELELLTQEHTKVDTANKSQRQTNSASRSKPQRLFHPQINYARLRTHTAEVAANNAARGAYDIVLDRIVAMSNLLVRAEHDVAELRRLRRELSDKMSPLVGKSAKALLNSQPDSSDQVPLSAAQLKSMRSDLFDQSRENKRQIQALEEQIARLQQALYAEARHIPNETHPQTPIGDESKAIVLEMFGSPLKIDPASNLPRLRTHIEIAEAHDMLDIERAGKVSGSRSYYLKNAGAMLELALIRYATDVCLRRGFVPVMTPDLIRYEVLEACGFSPRSHDPQTYYVSTADLSSGASGAHDADPMSMCLAATAEFPLAGMYSGETLENLPVRMVGVGHAFRAEGLSGATNRGLYRVHQFTKVEMFALTDPESSMSVFTDLVAAQKEIFEGLELCFRVLNMPTLELGAPAYIKYDIEAWMPGRGEWGEVSSTSNCIDYQSRRLNIRTFNKSSNSSDSKSVNAGQKDESKNPISPKRSNSGATMFVHTVNGTACAVPRVIIALLETHQQPDGSVQIPERLRPYLFGKDVSILRPGMPMHDSSCERK